MKKIFIIGLLIFSIKVTGAQTGLPDTLAYLNSIAANKAFFIGKPFSVLADSLKIEIKYFNQNTTLSYDIRKETSTSFGFFFPLTHNDFDLTYPRIEVRWRSYLDARESWTLWQTHRGSWATMIAAFYATGIVADIEIRE